MIDVSSARPSWYPSFLSLDVARFLQHGDTALNSSWRDANGVGRNGNSPEGIDKQIAAKPAAAELPIPPDHRDVSGGNVAMRRPGPRKRRRKIRKLNRVRIQGKLVGLVRKY